MVLESGPGISAVLYCQSAACAMNGLLDLVVSPLHFTIIFQRVFFFFAISIYFST